MLFASQRVDRMWSLDSFLCPSPFSGSLACAYGSFRPSVALSFVRDLLLFDDDEECVAFIQAAGGVVEGWAGPGVDGAVAAASAGVGPDGAPAPPKPCVWNTVASKIEAFKQVIPEPDEDDFE